MTTCTLWEKQPDALSFARLHTCQYEPIFPCWTSVLEEGPSLNCVFTIYTWKAGLYSSSRPEARRTQRNTTVGKILIPKRSYHLKTPDKEPAMKHTISEELQQSSSWMNKKIRPHRSVQVCTPKQSSATQTQEHSDNPWSTVARGDDHLLSSLHYIL